MDMVLNHIHDSSLRSAVSPCISAGALQNDIERISSLVHEQEEEEDMISVIVHTDDGQNIIRVNRMKDAFPAHTIHVTHEYGISRR